MARAPKWTDFPRYPVITITLALSIGVTLAWWAKVDISPLFETAEIRRGQLWRLVTSIFPHLDILHLAFNVYWVWVFGTLIEEVFGHVKTAGLIILFAIGSNSFDFALAHGGVGLSGVGYGLFGLLWVLTRRDERFRGALDEKTITLFTLWFVFCIVTTITDLFPVANVAHAAGAVLGALVGAAIVLRQRGIVVVAIVLFLSLGLWGATLGRPIVNVWGKAGAEEAYWGYTALVANHNQEALRWLRDATKYQPKNAGYWYNLGVANDRLGNGAAATDAYQRAHQLAPNNPSFAVPNEK